MAGDYRSDKPAAARQSHISLLDAAGRKGRVRPFAVMPAPVSSFLASRDVSNPRPSPLDIARAGDGTCLNVTLVLSTDDAKVTLLSPEWVPAVCHLSGVEGGFGFGRSVYGGFGRSAGGSQGMGPQKAALLMLESSCYWGRGGSLPSSTSRRPRRPSRPSSLHGRPRSACSSCGRCHWRSSQSPRTLETPSQQDRTS